MIEWKDFSKIDFRCGTITQVDDFPEARKPAYILTIDLGPQMGIKKSSAQITEAYSKETLIGQQVLCVCNFPPKQVGPIQSEVLVTGFVGVEGGVILAQPERKIPNGSRLA